MMKAYREAKSPFEEKHNIRIEDQEQNSVNELVNLELLTREEQEELFDDFQIYLEKRNIQTRVIFTGNVLKQPMMKNLNYKTNSSGYSNSDVIMKNGVLLPVHHGMTNKMFERLHSVIEEYINKNI